MKARNVAYREDRTTSITSPATDAARSGKAKDAPETAPDGELASPTQASGTAARTSDKDTVDAKAAPDISRAAPPAQAEKPKKKGKAKRVLLVLLLAGLGFGGYEGYNWWTEGRFIASTDDSYVSADITTVQSKISGYVASIEVEDNAVVREGDVLLRLDDGDYRLAVRAAQDGIAAADAAVARIDKQIAAAKAGVTQAEAAVEAAQARLDMAKADFGRQSRLVKSRVTSQATLDSADADRKAAIANLASGKAAVEVARANVEVLEGQRGEAEAAVASARTQLARAQRDLDFTVIRAPVGGVVGNRAAQVGTLLQGGSRVAAIVPSEDVHITANFKETQLGGIHAGAKARIEVDAYPDAEIHGTVDSISPATGSVFSLLPSENATGNFTKVVQRVPVRITVPAEEAAKGRLRPGMSVIVDIDTRTGPSATGAE